MWNVIQAEWMKIRKSSIWFPVILAPVLAIAIGFMASHHRAGMQSLSEDPWNGYYFIVVMAYSLLMLPLMTGVLCSLMCRLEHLSGGWKQILAFPIPRTTIYAVKFLYVFAFVALAQILVLLGVVSTGVGVLHIMTPIPWNMLFRSILGGWIAIIPLIALQLWVSTWWKSFGAPFAVNVILTIPGVAVAHSSRFGPVYPWAQPMLAMMPGGHHFLDMTTKTTSTIIISGVVLILVGWLHFAKRDITS
ncbi:ABC transporter permease [Alicyclobacillus acidiphilus]|uniref:ABC transporter permease n=1 Tax=Alicyclobacillus acidiphilus TaxID=182455 RepID=UPI0008372E8E|nr:ABC transporter permease [Alicyclobacillus acidiphilus]